ncbi:MAG: transposase [Pseudomonadota bacterium]
MDTWRGGMARRRRNRRKWSVEEKRTIIAQTRVPGVSVSLVARRYDMNANQLFNWMRDPRFAPSDADAENAAPVFLPVEIIGAAEHTPEPMTSAAPAGAIEIELANGCRLTVSGGFDPDAAARLARGLSG